ncbi:hypothetical protein G6O69_33795 [Pseudenhygromyxa sp. WMMC2535]|uniref:hypothetical protein n=1 Tax=Pseudenhygromyxa sp. WMMC2535 TaxID=2712867 RepID=UPI0015552DAF|nr:hypothetical protein [Pseudenhygromyxa sp. WMMC2535]NVB42843.1 hypothetical protein [Pseudenhygromyxa sp. WMMC2535]
MSRIEVITDFEPIRLMVQTGQPSELELRAFLAQEREDHARLLYRGQRALAVLDPSCGRGMRWVHEELRALWVLEHRAMLEQTLMGVAVLAGDCVDAWEWFSALAVPRVVLRDLDAAIEWGYALLAAEELRLERAS